MDKINIVEKNGKQLVSARELHTFLESKKQFADWIKHRISKYDLTEDVDYTSFSLNGENGGKSKEFALTLDTAKELAMVEGNAKGKQARKYFIECEQKLKAQPTKALSAKELALMVIQAEEEKERLQLQNEMQQLELKKSAPKVEFYDKVMSSPDSFTSTTIAKELGMSAVEFHKQMNCRGVMYRHEGHWVLYSKYQNKEYTKTRTHIYTDSQGTQRTGITTTWTQKGREFIHSLFNSNIMAIQPMVGIMEKAY